MLEELVKYEAPEGHKKIEFVDKNITLHFDWCPESNSYYVQLTDTKAGNFTIINFSSDELVAKESFEICKILATYLHDISNLKIYLEQELKRNSEKSDTVNKISTTTQESISLTT